MPAGNFNTGCSYIMTAFWSNVISISLVVDSRFWFQNMDIKVFDMHGKFGTFKKLKLLVIDLGRLMHLQWNEVPV